MSRIKDKLSRKLRKRGERLRHPFQRHEGMTSPEERMNLYRVASRCEEGQIVELGCYFGASTAALADGLAASGATDTRIHVFDAFQTPENTYFAARVEASADRSGTSRLLRREDGWLHWEDCFAKLCAPFSEHLVVHKAMMQDADWQGGPIGVLHIDMPKDYAVGKHVFAKLFPLLRPGSIILFQDFVYHWSAEMIAAFGFLMNASLVRPVNIVSHTLTLECQTNGQEILDRLNAEFASNSDAVLRGLSFGIACVENIANKEQLAILRIAQCQSLYHAGNTQEALKALGTVLQENPTSKQVNRGVSEVLQNVFDMNKSC